MKEFEDLNLKIQQQSTEPHYGQIFSGDHSDKNLQPAFLQYVRDLRYYNPQYSLFPQELRRLVNIIDDITDHNSRIYTTKTSTLLTSFLRSNERNATW